tara:strand:- start:2404 stop:2673 length:270 start_codon:yes stop_codon:yes gene_type:complete
MKPDTPYSIDGVSLFDDERALIRSLISSIHKVYRGSNEEVILMSAISAFKKIMEVKSGRWVRKKVFQIGNDGSTIDIFPSRQFLSIRDE